VKSYSTWLTADINAKGVLDVDTVKGCTAGMAASVGGCYQNCYAARIAKFRGIDFTRAVARRVYTKGQARKIRELVAAAPEGFFRVGTMGDPSHAWSHTAHIVEWLAPLAVPVIVTKHWLVASDLDLVRLVRVGAVLNTSVSALDTDAQLSHRLAQLERYSALGGVSVARVVSCAFLGSTHEAKRRREIQDKLLSMPGAIDNPLRLPKSHPLVAGGVVEATKALDLGDKPVSMSLHSPDSYLGHCSACPDKCGLARMLPTHPKPTEPQTKLFES